MLRATIVAFTSGSYTAELRLDGSTPITLTAVKTARNIASGDMTANRKVLIDPGPTGHPDDYVVVAVYTP